MKSLKLAAVAALAILAVAACGGSGAATLAPGTPTVAPSGGMTAAPQTVAPSTVAAATQTPAGAVVDPCKLLSAADLKTVTGVTYGDGVFDATYNWCTWTVSEANGGGEVILAISDNAFAAVKGALTKGVDLTVSGHAAFWDPESGVMSMLVDLGGKTLELSFPKENSDGPVDQAMAQKLAEIGIGKM